MRGGCFCVLFLFLFVIEGFDWRFGKGEGLTFFFGGRGKFDASFFFFKCVFFWVLQECRWDINLPVLIVIFVKVL